MIHLLQVVAGFSFLLLSFAICIPASPLQQRKFAISEDFHVRISSAHPSPPQPTTFFEVRRPAPHPKSPLCSTLVLHHDFAQTNGKPPVTTTYSPLSHCPHLRRRAPSRIVLEWSATCAGIQFDRIFGVWFAGVELLRSCTAEPLVKGIQWSVRKDVTRYASLFSKTRTLAVYLGNLVDQTYTGIYHVNISFHFYFDPMPSQASVPSFRSPADLIIPVSKSLPLNGGLWFQIQNSTDVQGKGIKIPQNAYRAVLEVYVSFHSDDEFWYTNPPNSYILENNLTSVPGNGAFREVNIRLDENVVGAIWPFSVIYTGGVNPLLWRPISAIGSFDLPSYDIEMTPYLGKILDGRNHFFGFGVTNSLNVWFIDANLHLWVDKNCFFTQGRLVNHEAPTFAPSLTSVFKDLDGHFYTIASRNFSSTGWVNSSYGNITTNFFQNFSFSSNMKISKNGSNEEVNHNIHYNLESSSTRQSALLYYENVIQSFPLYLYTGTEDETNSSYSLISNVTLGFNEKKLAREGVEYFFSNLRNLETGQGIMQVKKDLVTGGIASTQQVYRYQGSDGCYFRKVGSSNYTILYDESNDYCTKSSHIG